MPDAQDNRLQITWKHIAKESVKLSEGKIYGIPKGGLICALALVAGMRQKRLKGLMKDCHYDIVVTPDEADYLLDDIYDSGATARRYEKYGKPIHFLFDKRKPEYAGKWLQMPWEQDEKDISKKFIDLQQEQPLSINTKNFHRYLAVIKHTIGQYLNMEKYVTDIWTKRGCTWGED
jgi:hypothetical protein